MGKKIWFRSRWFWNNGLNVGLTLLFLFFGFGIANKTRGQSTRKTPTHFKYPNWIKLKVLNEKTSDEMIPFVKKSLGLTDEQMKAVKEMEDLNYQFAQQSAHDSPESVPWDPEKKKEFMDKCERQATKLASLLGDEKVNDSRQFFTETAIIKREIGNEKIDFSNMGVCATRFLSDIKNSDFYKAYKERKSKTFKSENEVSNYFSKHEKVLKLRIMYELYIYGFPMENNEKSLKEKKDEADARTKKRREILDELSQLQ